jgi:PadR family transcriptional regulator, regulatory protein PadR
MVTQPHRFRKDLVAGSYDLIILDVLRDGPAYGYGIRRRIFEQSQHTLLWRSATIYNVLHDLERQRLVASSWRGRAGRRQRRYYSLTARGRRVWQEQRREWRAFVAVVNALIS